MAGNRKEAPDFFDDHGIDPVNAAIGPGNNSKKAGQVSDAYSVKKKKAGFYLSVDLLERFNRKYHELKLQGILIDNKSFLLEAALSFALDDIDCGDKSKVLKQLNDSGIR
jgi:hypothetical protein